MVCILLCFVVVLYWWNLSISFKVTSMALGKSYSCSGEVILKYIMNWPGTPTTTTVKRSTKNMYMFVGLTVSIRLELCMENQQENIYSLVQDCSNSIAYAMELLQSCTKPSIRPVVTLMCIYAFHVTYVIAKWMYAIMYHQISNISCTKSKLLNVPHLVLQLSLPKPLQPCVKVENEDVVGTAPTGDAPTTSEWSAILLPTVVWLILEVWR